MKFNDAQKQAIDHDDTPLLVLSAAGTGKTTVLVHRAAKLIERGVDPSNILLCTFTNKATNEMSERLLDLVGEEVLEVMTVSTIHSFCFKSLKQEWSSTRDRKAKATVLTSPKYVIKKIVGYGYIDEIRERGLNIENEVDISAVLSRISVWKRNVVLPHEAYQIDETPGQMYAECYEYYERFNQAKNQIDFDDMLLDFWLLLDSSGEVARKYQDMFTHLLVDEFQDTDPLQYKILSTIALPENNVTFVGDDDQSIYKFRGADSHLMLSFPKNYPDGAIIKMELNYRSVPAILKTANNIIANNEVRYEKSLIPARKESSVEPQVMFSEDISSEGRNIAEQIEAMDAGDEDWHKYAILYRTNAQAEAIETALMRRQIPYEVVGSVGFYGRRDVKDVVAYLILAADPEGPDVNEACLRVVNIPSRYLGNAYKNKVQEAASRNQCSCFDAIARGLVTGVRSYTVEKGQDFVDEVLTIRHFSNTTASSAGDVVSFIRERFYDKHISKDTDNADDSDVFEVLNRLLYVAEEYATVEEFLEFYRKMTNASWVREDEAEEDTNKVKLMTVHKAKGLEFNTVFGAGIIQGLVPHYKNTDEEGIEEERRLMYVLTTRAKENLYYSIPLVDLKGNQAVPSQFLAEADLTEALRRPEIFSEEKMVELEMIAKLMKEDKQKSVQEGTRVEDLD